MRIGEPANRDQGFYRDHLMQQQLSCLCMYLDRHDSYRALYSAMIRWIYALRSAVYFGLRT